MSCCCCWSPALCCLTSSACVQYCGTSLTSSTTKRREKISDFGFGGIPDTNSPTTKTKSIKPNSSSRKGKGQKAASVDKGNHTKNRKGKKQKPANVENGKGTNKRKGKKQKGASVENGKGANKRKGKRQKPTTDGNGKDSRKRKGKRQKSASADNGNGAPDDEEYGTIGAKKKPEDKNKDRSGKNGATTDGTYESSSPGNHPGGANAEYINPEANENLGKAHGNTVGAPEPHGFSSAGEELIGAYGGTTGGRPGAYGVSTGAPGGPAGIYGVYGGFYERLSPGEPYLYGIKAGGLEAKGIVRIPGKGSRFSPKPNRGSKKSLTSVKANCGICQLRKGLVTQPSRARTCSKCGKHVVCPFCKKRKSIKGK